MGIDADAADNEDEDRIMKENGENLPSFCMDVNFFYYRPSDNELLGVPVRRSL